MRQVASALAAEVGLGVRLEVLEKVGRGQPLNEDLRRDVGARHANFVFDDEGAVLMRAIHDVALRPRRGGPRFMDAEERAAAKALSDDPRTNEQLAYDLMIDVLHAGALADAATVFGGFGGRQASPSHRATRTSIPPTSPKDPTTRCARHPTSVRIPALMLNP